MKTQWNILNSSKPHITHKLAYTILFWITVITGFSSSSLGWFISVLLTWMAAGSYVSRYLKSVPACVWSFWRRRVDAILFIWTSRLNTFSLTRKGSCFIGNTRIVYVCKFEVRLSNELTALAPKILLKKIACRCKKGYARSRGCRKLIFFLYNYFKSEVPS